MAGLRQRAFVPGLLFVGMVVSVISSLGAPLIPAIATDFATGIGSAQWSLTVTMLVGAVASPVVGRLGDGPYRREVLLGCLASVTVGGILAAVAESLVVLIVGRALQGMGLALMPLTMAATRDRLPAAQAVRVIATLSVIGAVGLGLGYPITGVIAQHLGLSAAFWFGGIISALALLVTFLVLPSARHRPAARRIDVVGAVLIAAGLAGLLIGLEKGATWGWGSTPTIALLLGAGATLTIWTRHSLRTEDPLVDLRLVRHRAVLTANVAGLLIGIATYLMISLMMQVVQLDDGLNASVLTAGVTLVPLSIMSLIASSFLPAVERRVGRRAAVPAGTIAISLAACFYAATGNALWQAFATMALVGVGLGITLSAMPSMIVAAVPRSETSSAMSFYQVTRYVGYSVGSGLAVAILLIVDPGGHPTAGAYDSAFLVSAGFGLLAALSFWALGASASSRSSAGLSRDPPTAELVGNRPPATPESP